MAVSQTLQLVLALIVVGLGTGMLYAMLGLAVTLVFGLGGVLNLATGMFSVLSVLAAIWLLSQGPSLGIAIVVGIVAVAALGYATDKLVLPLVYRAEGDERFLLGVFGTLGLGILLQGLTELQYNHGYKLPAHFPPFSVSGIFLRISTLVIVVVAFAVFVALYLFFSRTYEGQATRTIMQDETGAILCGIDVRRLKTEIFVLSAVIAGIAGLLWSLNASVSASESFELATYGILVSIAGGVTSITGTVVAGIILGFVSNLVATFVGSYWSNVVIFLLVIGAIIIRSGRLS